MNDIEADLLIANAKIKQLEQELAEKTNEVESMRSNWYKCSKNYQQKCRDIAELEIKLAEIQRRERAAVEFIRSAREDSDGDWGDLVFMIDEWLQENERGPQEAWKGDSRGAE